MLSMKHLLGIHLVLALTSSTARAIDPKVLGVPIQSAEFWSTQPSGTPRVGDLDSDLPTTRVPISLDSLDTNDEAAVIQAEEASTANEQAGTEVTIWVPCDKDFTYPPGRRDCQPAIQKFRQTVTWVQIFQIGAASAAYVAGAGVGRQVLNDPLATAEGVLNFPVIVSQLAIIMTEVFLIDNVVYTWDPFAVAKLIENISIIGAAFALLSQNSLAILFDLKKFPDSVNLIHSYGGAALFHGGMIALHAVQIAVIKFDVILSWLMKQFILGQGVLKGDVSLFKQDEERTKQHLASRDWTPHDPPQLLDDNLRDTAQQSREILQCLNTDDPLRNLDLNHCQSISRANLQQIVDLKGVGHGHSHGHGIAAILADIIAHGVALPTFFMAWLLVTVGTSISDLGVAWTAQLSTIILLACLIHSSLQDAMKVWKLTGGEAPPGVIKEMTANIDANFKDKYSDIVEKVEFTTRKISAQSYSLYYVSFYVSVYPQEWHRLDESTESNGGIYMLRDEMENALRKVAYSSRAYDFSRLDRGSKNGQSTKMVYWLLGNDQDAGQASRIIGRDDAGFAGELDHMFDQSQILYILMQHLDGVDDLLAKVKADQESW